MTDETKQAGADTSRNEDSSQSNAGSTSKETPKTYTEQDVLKMVSDRLATAGREAKVLETRKAELERREQEIAQWRTRKEEEELEVARGDPDKLNSYQEKKRLRDEKEELSKQRREWEQEKLAHEVEIEEARATKREIDIFDIAQEYEGGDAVKLKKLCDTAKITSKEQIREAANTIWEKKGKQPEGTPKPKHDSGMTIGGTKDLEGLSRKELYEQAYSKK